MCCFFFLLCFSVFGLLVWFVLISNSKSTQFNCGAICEIRWIIHCWNKRRRIFEPLVDRISRLRHDQFFLLHVQCNILNSKETLHHNAKLVKIKPMKKYYTLFKSEVELHLQLRLILYCLPSRSRAIHTTRRHHCRWRAVKQKPM